MADLDRETRFRAIYVSNYARVLGYALRRTESADDAADVVAETFLATWRRLEDIPQGEESRLWLYGVARRVLANHRRGGARRARLAVRLGRELAVFDSAASTTGESNVDRLHAAFGALRQKDQEVLGLVAWEDLRTEDLAKVMGCTRNAAKIRLHRARKRFASELLRQGLELKPAVAPGHVGCRRAAARPDAEETS